jgi:hypothetical protein
MSTYVYIALDGLRTSPISEEAWLSAVLQCDELVILPGGAPGAGNPRVVRLKTDRRATVRLDRFGIASARDPSKEMIDVMFKVASALNANVYSERFNKYASTDDWICRRKKQRRIFDKQRAYKEKEQILLFGLWCILCTAAALVGTLLDG